MKQFRYVVCYVCDCLWSIQTKRSSFFKSLVWHLPGGRKSSGEEMAFTTSIITIIGTTELLSYLLSKFFQVRVWMLQLFLCRLRVKIRQGTKKEWGSSWKENSCVFDHDVLKFAKWSFRVALHNFPFPPNYFTSDFCFEFITHDALQRLFSWGMYWRLSMFQWKMKPFSLSLSLSLVLKMFSCI